MWPAAMPLLRMHLVSAWLWQLARAPKLPPSHPLAQQLARAVSASAQVLQASYTPPQADSGKPPRRHWQTSSL